ncbi:hypothetical protein EC968_010458 [Mortierella alpina]|nr:hypothetical protein EC968_010458 [Mortierella alpina]
MLDLATAKAENITGLYFARQLNLKATSAYSLMEPAETTSATQKPDLDDPPEAVKVTSSSSERSGGGVFEEACNIRIEVSASSPVVRPLCYEHGQGGVERDLEKALHFYQQAADQGHTKASYNIGCICYNLGEVSKAMAWFESAGKCSVRGLRAEDVEKSLPSSSDPAPLLTQCPVPKHTSLPHELEDMLLGDMATTSGPFAAYLPAILCLALLCRQGVQDREGSVILKRDSEQAVELLQRLLQRTSARSHLGARGGDSQEAANDVAGSSKSRTHGDLRKRSSLDFQTSAGCSSTIPLAHPAIAPTSLSTSCPSLPLGQWSIKSGSSHGSVATYEPLVDSLAVEDALAGERNCRHDMASGSGTHSGSVNSTFSAELQGPELHEAWSATLALQLLKAWTRQSADWQEPVTTTNDIGLDQKILRHHLLYITNPTLGKNLYNLGVLYDIYLGGHLIAARCYESAYRNSRLATDESYELHPALVTRINSAWNLGVLHAKNQNWSQAKGWFLKAQQDVLLHARRQSEQSLRGGVEDQVRGDRTKALTSLVNVLPGNMRCLPNDSAEKARAREHGLMMHFPSHGSSSKAKDSSGGSKRKRALKKQKHLQAQDGLETDATKVAWVLRWIDSNMKSST